MAFEEIDSFEEFIESRSYSRVLFDATGCQKEHRLIQENMVYQRNQ